MTTADRKPLVPKESPELDLYRLPVVVETVSNPSWDHKNQQHCARGDHPFHILSKPIIKRLGRQTNIAFSPVMSLA